MIAGAVYAGASMNEEDDDRANNDREYNTNFKKKTISNLCYFICLSRQGDNIIRFSKDDGKSNIYFTCGYNRLVVLSAFYGNATASCGPHDITANFTTTTTGNFDITSLYIFSVTPVNFGNLCQGSTNTFSGEVYCDTTVTCK